MIATFVKKLNRETEVEEFFRSPVWRRIVTLPDHFIRSIITELITAGCYQFIKKLIDFESSEPNGVKKSNMLTALRNLKPLIPPAVCFPTISEMLWFVRWAKSEVDDRIVENILFSILVDSLGEMESNPPIFAWVIDYTKTYHLEVNPPFVFSWARKFAKNNFIPELRMYLENIEVFGEGDDYMRRSIGSIIAGGVQSHRPEVLRLAVPYIRHIPTEDIISTIETYFGKYQERLDDSLECFKILYEEYPHDVRSVLIPKSGEQYYSIGNLIDFGSIPLIDYVLSLGLTINPKCLDFYLRVHLLKTSAVPQHSIPIVEYLRKKGFAIDGDAVLREVSMARKAFYMHNGFNFSHSIFRVDALTYLKFLESAFGQRIFSYMNSSAASRCLDCSMSWRRQLRISGKEFVAAFRFAFERSGLSWTKELSDIVDNVRGPYLKEILREMANDLVKKEKDNMTEDNITR